MPPAPSTQVFFRPQSFFGAFSVTKFQKHGGLPQPLSNARPGPPSSVALYPPAPAPLHKPGRVHAHHPEAPSFWGPVLSLS